MHGVKKSDLTPERLEKVKANVEKYNKLNQHVLRAKKKREYSSDMLSMCDEILSINPEHYTVWNYRREMITHWLTVSDITDETQSESLTTQTLSDEDKHALLNAELQQTNAALKRNPKSYCAFFHRRWTVETDQKDADLTSNGRTTVLDLRKELALCTQFLKMDARNFHCWDYRRFIVRCMSVSSESMANKMDESELQYSTSLIEENFSNYSAWHSRALLLSKSGLTEHTVRQELEFASNAMFTEPNDQSAWLYQRWLLHTANEMGVLEDSVLSEQFDNCADLLSEESDAKWALIAQIMVAHLMVLRGKDVSQLSSFDLKRNIDKLTDIDPKRKGYYSHLYSQLDGCFQSTS